MTPSAAAGKDDHHGEPNQCREPRRDRAILL